MKKIASLKETFKSVSGNVYLKGTVSETEEVAFTGARFMEIGDVLTIKGHGTISQNNSSEQDRLDLTFSIPSIGDIYNIPIVSQELLIGSDFSFEITISDVESDQGERLEFYKKVTIGKQLQPTQIITGTGDGYQIGKDYAFSVKLKHSTKSQPQSTFEVKSFVITKL